jgi:hypothetical protein
VLVHASNEIVRHPFFEMASLTEIQALGIFAAEAASRAVFAAWNAMLLSAAMAAHYGQDIERTKLRRMALEVEKRAVDYAEAKRADALLGLSGEARTNGVQTLMVEADGGMIRTGELIDLDPTEPGYGEETKRGTRRRKRPTQYRELITMDAREPGETEPTTLDVLVPVGAPAGERSRRLLALAGRKGLGDNTSVKGLGDLGSALPAAFDEAFVKCPVKTLAHYVTNNWHRMKSAQRKAEGLPFVSARAEAQVRERSKKRFNVAGAWKLENLEPKATLRAIIHEGDWESFKRSQLAAEQSSFAQALQARLKKSVIEGRLGPGVISDVEAPMPASAQADRDLPQAHAG